MKIQVDTNACVGTGFCEAIRSDIFEVGDDGVVTLLTEEFTEADRADLEDAVAQCPMGALYLEG
ncbi:ferredoxin [Hoyosella subflava]|uniref:Putative ferredoxin n=1 Tax=Hoyosella subflava (strain DSM 45089 / JCM 17490 / NBRC 109087 / DQS3-9A1) TaxID=443218 RepID=F6EQ50_HOYSD|nr:ferredoxin [Hoyosella subflava]AEF39473.1 Putative ferredoxin [Hoyosella subflava DQS3-9A1]